MIRTTLKHRRTRNFQFILSIAIFLIFSTTEASVPEDTVKPSPTFWQNRKDEFISPWTTPAQSWFIYGSLTTLALVALADDIDNPLQKSVSQDKPLGKSSKIGDLGGQAITNLIYILGMGGTYWLTENTKAKSHGLVMLKATGYAIGVSSALKYVTHEPRPSNSAGNRDYYSFPSGHSTAAFAFSSVIVAEHGMWPWGFAATSLSVLTAFSRINDNAHYLHDVVAGFTIGTSYGLGISYLEKSGSNKVVTQFKKHSFMILPAWDSDFKGLMARYEF